ncbi:MAG: transporter substrate-binding domain-containing protein [Phycisphaerales bacterium]
MNIQRILAVGCIAMTTLPGATARAQPVELTDAERAWLAAHPQITLGPLGDYTPVQFIDEHGVHRGLVADYVARIEELLSIQFTLVHTDTWQEILDKARDRQIDVIALAAETTDRRTYLSFTSPYLDLPAVIIARETVEKQLTLADLAGLRVAVTQGYAVHDYLTESHPGLLLDPVVDTRTGLRKVSFGMSDVFISDLAVASHFIQQEGITNLRVVGESGFVYHMGFATRNDWPVLAGILEKALAAIPPDERASIFRSWISLSQQTESASGTLMFVLLGTIASVVAVAVSVIVWNASLHRRVRQRTGQIEESEERVRRIIGTALDGVITMNAGGIVTGWSDQAETTFGWTREEATGRVLAELIIPERLREAHQKGIARFLATAEGPVLNRRIEITGLHKQGHEIPVELAIAPIQTGATFEFCAFVRDITERRRAKEEIERHQDELEHRVTERTAELQRAKEAAEQALGEVKQLQGLLPICSYCKRVREGEQYTLSVEAYLAEHTDAQLSHGVCPDCYEKHVRPEVERL